MNPEKPVAYHLLYYDTEKRICELLRIHINPSELLLNVENKRIALPPYAYNKNAWERIAKSKRNPDILEFFNFCKNKNLENFIIPEYIGWLIVSDVSSGNIFVETANSFLKNFGAEI